MCEKDISTNFETNLITDKDLNLMQTISLNKPKKKVSFDNNLRVAYVQSFKSYNKIKYNKIYIIFVYITNIFIN